MKNNDTSYLMEHEDEIHRLERKTDITTVRQQASWAGLRPGMRVADIGCGAGVTTRTLFDMIQPGGEAVGIDISQSRIAYARNKYGAAGLRFEARDVLEPMADMGEFDFVWVRFFLEYHRGRAFQIVQNLARFTRPGGILCLIDLDHNCLNHFAMPDRLIDALRGIMYKLEADTDFDPHIGIKLYSFLYDLGFDHIDVALNAHHLIYGSLQALDAFNWKQKVEVAVARSGYAFEAYPGGFREFAEEFETFFSHPRRFTYTPVILCRGQKPQS